MYPPTLRRVHARRIAAGGLRSSRRHSGYRSRRSAATASIWRAGLVAGLVDGGHDVTQSDRVVDALAVLRTFAVTSPVIGVSISMSSATTRRPVRWSRPIDPSGYRAPGEPISFVWISISRLADVAELSSVRATQSELSEGSS